MTELDFMVIGFVSMLEIDKYDPLYEHLCNMAEKHGVKWYNHPTIDKYARLSCTDYFYHED